MRTSYSLLQSYISYSLAPEELAHKLTQQGLEVESILPYGTGLQDLLVAEVLKKDPHPNADKLSVCEVLAGKETFQVVCGATNFKVHDKVVFAPSGTTLPDGKLIQAASLRGVESQGMLCSGRELGLFDSQEGLWILPENAPSGESIENWMPELKDWIFDVSLTPNRGDCLSTIGIAREVAILQNQTFFLPNATLPTNNSFSWDLKIETSHCHRYLGFVVKNVNVTESPLWLKIALKKYGLRSINNIVDISNFVMLERGTPIHIFDLDTLSFPLSIRDTAPGETITLLSGKEVPLPEGTMVISDTKENLALAGIMGGIRSGVSSSTKNIFVEVACFSPEKIRQSAKTLNMSTDSSYRFVRGIDIEAIPSSAAFLLEKLLQTTPGDFVAMKDLYPSPLVPQGISVSLEKIQATLGFPLSYTQVESLLSLLNFSYKSDTTGQYETFAPSYRNDCSLDVDVIEELIRVYGYDKLPSQPPSHSFFLQKPSFPLEFSLRDLLTVEGYQEIYNFSFVQKEKNEQFSLLGAQSIPLENPLNSDFSHLRTSLLAGAFNYLKEMFTQGKTDLNIFEIGQVFYETKDSHLTESKNLILIKSGSLTPRGILGPKTPVTFFDLKDSLQSLFHYLGAVSQITYTPSSRYDFLHPHKTAEISYKGESIGYIGEIHPGFWHHLKKNQSSTLIVAEITLSPHFEGYDLIQSERTYRPFSRFPTIERDLSFILDNTVPASEILDEIHSSSPLLKTAYLTDQYEDAKFGDNKKNLSFRMVFQSLENTLMDEDIQPTVDGIISWVKSQKNGILREF